MRRSSVSSGQPSVENGHRPELNQVSSTSLSCVSFAPPHLGHFVRRTCGARMAFDNFDARIERGNHFFAVGAMPDGNAMAPPELARDAPVANIFEPVAGKWCADCRATTSIKPSTTTSVAGSASGFIFMNHCVETRGSTIALQRSQVPTECVCSVDFFQ